MERKAKKAIQNVKEGSPQPTPAIRLLPPSGIQLHQRQHRIHGVIPSLAVPALALLTLLTLCGLLWLVVRDLGAGGFLRL